MCIDNLIFEKFWETIGNSADTFSIWMGDLIPGFIGGKIVKAVIGGEVDDLFTSVQVLNRLFGRSAVRQATENAISFGGYDLGIIFFNAQVQSTA